MSTGWGSQHTAPSAPQHLSRDIQTLVRQARCYPPEREPRIVRDVYDCCRHFQGLRPRNELCYIDSSETIPLLALVGVIPITYRSVVYQIPVIIWVPPHYPNEAPVPYVRPTPSMVLRERHRHVDREGRVYLQHYLSIWDPSQFTLYGLVVAMSRVFSAEPPVNSRPIRAAPPADEPERRRLIASVSQRLSARLTDVSNDAVMEIAQLLDRKTNIIQRDESASEEMRLKTEQYADDVERLNLLEERKQELERWDETTKHVRNETDVDVVLQYREIMLKQIADSMAEDHAYADALDQVDEAFVKGVIDHETYMKDVRNISRDQFFPRALWKKLDTERLRMGVADDSALPRSTSSRLQIPAVPMRSM